MSSLQKFHRRSNNAVAAVAPLLGSGSDTTGYYLGVAGDGTSYMYVAPKSTESPMCSWGSSGTIRGTISTTDGITNTNTLYALGSAAHPAAYYCKSVTTGGYNTWYLPAKNELTTLYTNKAQTPFATANAFNNSRAYWSSTEVSGVGGQAWVQNIGTGGGTQVPFADGKYRTDYIARAVRRSVV